MKYDDSDLRELKSIYVKLGWNEQAQTNKLRGEKALFPRKPM